MKHATFVDVGKKLFHLFIKKKEEHKYYNTLQALFNDNKELGVSKFTLDRYKFEQPYENLQIIIRKGEALSTGDIKKKPIKKKATKPPSK